MAMTNSERQGAYRDRLKRAAYENEMRDAQIKLIETALNEVRAKIGLAEIQLVNPAGARPK